MNSVPIRTVYEPGSVLNGYNFVLIAVAPSGFDGLTLGYTTEVWSQETVRSVGVFRHVHTSIARKSGAVRVLIRKSLLYNALSDSRAIVIHVTFPAWMLHVDEDLARAWPAGWTFALQFR